jgi:anti-sigma B factor antagonist
MIDARQSNDRVTVLAPKGQLTISTVAPFRESLEQLIQSGVNRVVVDLGEVTFMDTLGMAAMISGMKKTRERDGELRIARPSDVVRLTLTVTALSRVLRAYDSVEDALEGF